MSEEYLENEKKLNLLANHLISPVGVPIRNAVLVDQGGKEVKFFKGSFYSCFILVLMVFVGVISIINMAYHFCIMHI